MGNARVGAQDSNAPLPGGAIANTSISDAELAADAVTTAKIASNAVTSDKIANSSVTADKVADASITAAKVANNAIGGAKLSTINLYSHATQYGPYYGPPFNGSTSQQTITVNLPSITVPSSAAGVLHVFNYNFDVYTEGVAQISITLNIAGRRTNVSASPITGTSLATPNGGGNVSGGYWQNFSLGCTPVVTTSITVPVQVVFVYNSSTSAGSNFYFRNHSFYYSWQN